MNIVGLNYERDDAGDPRTLIEKFVKEEKVPYPCLIGDAATQERIPKFDAYPTTLFLDRSGKVRARLVGFVPGHALVLETLVTTLLDGPEK